MVDLCSRGFVKPGIQPDTKPEDYEFWFLIFESAKKTGFLGDSNELLPSNF